MTPKPDPVEARFSAAFAHHQAGRLAEAERGYRDVLRLTSTHADAQHLLGLVLHQTGRDADAVEQIRRAIAINGRVATFHCNLGEVLRGAKREAEAEKAYRRAVTLDPSAAIALRGLGMGCAARGEHASALIWYERALAARAGFAAAWNDRGVSQLALGRPVEAAASFARAVREQPGYAVALDNLGVALQRNGQLDQAIDAHRRALAARPDNAGILSNLGAALARSRKLREAAECYRRALAVDPGHVIAHFDLGNVTRELGDMREAEASYRRAVALKPDDFPARHNLAVLLKNQRRWSESVALFEGMLADAPADIGIKCTLIMTLVEQGRIAEAEAAYAALRSAPPERVFADGDMLLALQYLPSVGAAELHAAARAWSATLAAPAVVPHIGRHRGPLRVGYVSPDFRQHSCASFLEPLLRGHDRRRVAVTCFADVAQADSRTAIFRELADRWIDTTAATDAQFADQVREADIDILVDCAGHTRGNRLDAFARRAAPVQVTWLGYPGTTGLSAMDYRLTDAIADPPGADAFAVERLVRLPRGFLCYQPPAEAPEPLVLDAAHITFGSCNNLAKLSPPVLACWSRILAAIPDARLLLKAKQFGDPPTRALALDRLAAHGIDRSRVDVRPIVESLDAHLAIYREIDIALDTFPYNGVTTTCEAVWMGTPVVALRGDRHAARVGASLLTRLGLGELIAATPDDYVAIAVALAQDRSRLGQLRISLRSMMAASPLCDAAGFTASVEEAYRTMLAGP